MVLHPVSDWKNWFMKNLYYWKKVFLNKISNLLYIKIVIAKKYLQYSILK